HTEEFLSGRATQEETVWRAMMLLFRGAAPFMLLLLVAGLAINLLQVGVLFTVKPLIPKLKRINPISGFAKFFTARTAVELAKSLAKLAFVGAIAWFTLSARTRDMILLALLTPGELVDAISAIIFALWWRVVAAMTFIGLLDYAFQRWQNERDLRMTQQEFRQEMKEMEGDPHIRRRVRQLQRQLAMQRMMAEVPTADVIITNPTEYAVALRYAMNEMAAPVVVAKGARIIAQRIRDLAVAHDVPIVERPELARTLYRTVDIGRAIPETLFRAVAEVLSFVYRIDRRVERVREREAAWRATRAAV
ncbi:MAG TPA: EscU/YscU/HrcU family type III secretion system export apparatus switch protein, partial [Candidatus Hydrogenedentes bacterium]|nr:EscU/YscU/HrcU family type III secretion system export apparatus switch protein [Candidatus Hydrogenedentota bacterium]